MDYGEANRGKRKGLMMNACASPWAGELGTLSDTMRGEMLISKIKNIK